MITKIKLRSGPSKNAAVTEWDCQRLVAIVGPNQSGKSLLLSEIARFIQKAQGRSLRILESLEAAFPDGPTAKEMIERRVGSLDKNNTIYKWDLIKTSAASNFKDLIKWFEKKQYNEYCYSNFLWYFTLQINGATRLSLLNDHPSQDLQEVPKSLLACLATNDAYREEWRNLVAEALDRYIVIDMTGLNTFRVRVSDRAPANSNEEQGLSVQSRQFHANSMVLNEYSDGFKAYAGITAAILASDYKVMLIDEPEAFLHPPLAQKLGNKMAQMAFQRDVSIFTSTHSPSFLMGCLLSGYPVDIVRLTYDYAAGASRLLRGEDLLSLMQDPLLRSSGVLNGLFCSSAVVCESDSDRAFYQEVNHTLESQSEHIRDTVFMNAQNKSTIRRLIQPLRRLGVPAAAVVDLDIIKDGNDLSALMSAAQMPSCQIGPLGALRGNIYKIFKDADKNPKSQGIDSLSGSNRAACVSFIDQCATYGVFIVPCGSLEQWLGELEITGYGPEWVINAFDRMRSLEIANKNLIKNEDEVYTFIRRIAEWTTNPQRLGVD